MVGEPIPGAEIYVELEPDNEPIANVTTDDAGEFTFQVLADSNMARPFPRNGTFGFVVKPPLGSATQSQKSVRLSVPFTRKDDPNLPPPAAMARFAASSKTACTFTYVLVWTKPDAKAQTKGSFAVWTKPDANAQTKGAFAVSGKSES